MIEIKTVINEENIEPSKVKISRDDFAKICRDNSILQSLTRTDYEEIRYLFDRGYKDFDAAVNDLWNADDNHSRSWYVNLLRKYITDK